MHGTKRLATAVGIAILSAAASTTALAQNGRDSREPESRYGPGYTPETIAGYERNYRDYQRHEGERRERLGRPEARAARQRSRAAYRRLSRAEARQLVRDRFPATIEPSGFQSLESQPGIEEVEYLDDTQARIRRSNGRRSLVVSAGTPMRAPTDSGDKRPVSLDLVERENYFEPANPVVEARIPKLLSDGVRLGSHGIGIDLETPPGVGPVEGELTGAATVYSQVAADTDFLVKPTPAGIETFTQIRSPEAPESHKLRFTLPAGARLSGTVDGGAEIVRGEETLAIIMPPSAKDAQDQDVPVSYGIDGATLELRVPHREADLAYPILVDPTVNEDWYNYAWIQGNREFTGWYKNNPWYWKFNLEQWSGNPAHTYGSGWGLYVFAKPEWYDGNYAQWVFDAPGSTSYFRRASFRNAYLHPDYQYTEVHDGIWHQNGYWSAVLSYGSSYNVGVEATDQVPSSPQGGRKIIHSMWVPNQGRRNRWASAYVGGVWLEIDDPEGADVQSVGPGLKSDYWLKSAWLADTIRSADPGVGVQRVSLIRPGGVYDSQYPCGKGDRNSRCPNEWSRDAGFHTDWLPQGISRMRAEAADAIGKVRGTSEWNIYVDRTQPFLQERSGPLYAAGGTSVGSNDSLSVQVAAGDSLAGIGRIDLKVDGTIVGSPLGDCGRDGCSQSGTLSWSPGGWPDGDRTVSIEAQDRATRPSPNTKELDRWTVRLDRQAPTVTAQARDLPSGWISDARPKARIFADDAGAGVKSVGLDARLESSPSGQVDWTGPSKVYDCAGTIASPCPRTAAGRQTRILRPTAEIGDDYSGARGYDQALPHQQAAGEAPASSSQIDDLVTQPAEADWYMSDHLELFGTHPAARVRLSNAALAGGERVMSLKAWALTAHPLPGEDEPDGVEAGSDLRLELYDTVNNRSLASSNGSSVQAWRSLEYALPAGQALTQQELDGLELRLSGSDALLYAAYLEVETDNGAPELTYNEAANPLPEGIMTLRAFARDASQPPNQAAATWGVKLDRGEPTVTVSGSLKEREDQYLYDPAYQIHVEAHDRSASGPRAGVDRIELLVDDEPQGQPVRQLCLPNTDSCSLEGDFEFLTAQQEDGLHNVTVKVVDRAGNVKSSSWKVFVDSARRSLVDQERPSYEIRGARTSDTRTFLDERGLHTELLRVGSRYFENSGGDSQEYNNLLESIGPGLGWQTLPSDYGVKLPKDANGLVRYSADGYYVEFSLAAALGVPGVQDEDGSGVVYRNAFPGVDVAYTAEDGTLKEELKLTSISETTPTTFTYPITFSPELSAQPTPDGAIDFIDAAGERRFGFEPPVMADSTGTAAGFSRALSLALVPAGPGRATVTLTADRLWITDPARRLPVAIDPTVTRRRGRGSWDPTSQALAFGNATSSNGQCCDLEPRGAHDYNPDSHPQNVDLDYMALNGLEYMRMGVYPCLYGSDNNFATMNDGYQQQFDKVFTRTAGRRVQVLPFMAQGVNCEINLSPRENPPDEPEEWSDLRNAGKELAYRYGPIWGADGATGPGQFWRDRGCARDKMKCAVKDPATGEVISIYYLPVRVWQVWNEPNISRSWGGEAQTKPGMAPPTKPDIDPVAYRNALFHAREGLRQGDPGARVLMAGLGGNNRVPADQREPDGQPTSNRRLGAGQFLEAVIEPAPDDTPGQGNHCAFDAVAMHFYDRDGLPEGNLKTGKPKGFASFLERNFRRPLDRSPFTRGTDIWVTEFGAAYKDVTDKQRAKLLDYGPQKVDYPKRTAETQKAWVKQVMDLALASGGGWQLGPMIHFNWQDAPEDGVLLDQRYFYRTGLWGTGGVPEATEPPRTRYDRVANTGRKPAGDIATEYGLGKSKRVRKLNRRGVTRRLPPQRCLGYNPTISPAPAAG